MLMREGPLDTLDRHRSTFVKSLNDGIGKLDAGAEFYFSAISAERRGYVLSQEDQALLKMFNSVLLMKSQEVTGPSGNYDLSTEGQGFESAQGLDEAQMSDMLRFGSGMELSDNPSYQEHRITPPLMGQTVAGLPWKLEPNNQDPHDVYADHDYLGTDLNPLHGEYHNIVGDFYVHPTDHTATSQSEKDHHKEARWENWVRDDKQHDFLRNQFHYGQLAVDEDLSGNVMGATNHAFYLRDYQNWLGDNTSKVDEITNQMKQEGRSGEEIDHAIKLAHINEKKQYWKENLGFMDYFHGLEWFTPEEKDRFYRHVQENGYNPDRMFRVDRHSGNPNLIPRVIRNIQQRFSGLHDHWTRDPDRPGHGMLITPIGMSEEGDEPSPGFNYEALLNHQPMGKDKNAWQRAVAHFNKMMEQHHYATNSAGRYEPLTERQVPQIDYSPDNHGIDSMLRHDMVKDQREDYYPNYNALRFMLGLDPDGNIYPKGQHPFYGQFWDGGEFTQEEVDSIMDARKTESMRVANAGRMAQNHSSIHYGYAMHPDHYDYLDDHETLATHWQKPFKGHGGLGKDANDLYNLIHHHSLLYSEKEDKERTDKLEELKDRFKGLVPDEELEEYVRSELGSEFEQDIEGRYKGSIFSPKENSLWFSRTRAQIEPRHDYDLQTGAIQSADDYKVLNALAPFGQREMSMSQQKEKGSGKLITTTVRGSPLDAPQNLKPHNVIMSSSVKGSGGQNAHYARHAQTVDSAFNNMVHDDYHAARRSGDSNKADRAHKKLQGRGALRVAHSYTGKGGALNPEPMQSHRTHSYHTIGTKLGMRMNPMYPQQDVMNLKNPRVKHTVGGENPLDKILQLRDSPVRQGAIEEVKQAELDKIERDYESAMSRANAVPDEDRKREEIDRVVNEYNRRLERLDNRFGLAAHSPTKEFGVEPTLNPAGSVTPQISEARPPSDELALYEEEIANISMLEAQLEEGGLSGEDEFKVHKLIADKQRLLDELEDKVDPLSTKGRRYSLEGHDTILENKLRADTDAIKSAMVHLKNMLANTSPEVHDYIFNPNLDHETAEANMRMFANMANDYLLKVPHEQHGIYTKGHARIDQTGNQTKVDDMANMKRMVHEKGTEFNIADILDMPTALEKLGLDPESIPHQKNLHDLIKDVFQPRFEQYGMDYKMPIMTMRQYLQATDPEMDIDGRHEKVRHHHKTSRDDEFANIVQGMTRRITNPAFSHLNERLGVHYQNAYNEDDRRVRELTDEGQPLYDRKKTAQSKHKNKHHSRYWNTKQYLDSLIVGFPEIEPPAQVKETVDAFTAVPADQFSPYTHSVHSLYNSAGYRHEFGDFFEPNFKFKISRNGNVNVVPVAEGESNKQPLVNILGKFWDAVAPPEWLEMLKHPDHEQSRQLLLRPDRMAANDRPGRFGIARNTDVHSVRKSDIGLADLTNPDILRKELGSEVPILQPMHRIFELDDLEELRGFTGDWIVSHMPEGERGFVKKEDDEVSSKTFDLSDEDKENFKKVTDEDFTADVIKTEEGYYIFDVIEFAEKEVHNVVLNDRIKIVRGALEGVENIHVPSASDTRLTDDEGLKAIVENLSETHENLLLRDAKSVYMVGELRHPKWVMLKPGNDVVLRVLERRGSGPYTYRLGTGPITREEEIGNRAVESDGEIYMDVGVAFNSEEKYNEGDHVMVNAANVSKVETTGGDDVYTLTASKILGEAEGEGLVSRETLGLLAKSEDQWLCEVHRAKSGVRVVMPQGDVLYKCTQTGSMWTVHSPLADSKYLVRLAESQRQYWSPIAGAMLKANLHITEKEEVHESQGDAEPLIEPHKEEDTNWWKEKEKKKILVKGLMLIDRFLKSGAGSVGGSNAGAKGLGIDYATPVESPLGPTNLHDEKTMPDFDNRKRPGEDSYIEPKSKDSEDEKNMTIPTEEGTLEITSDKAVFHT
jgi:hypothetical protein